jgi:hypothetical protein
VNPGRMVSSLCPCAVRVNAVFTSIRNGCKMCFLGLELGDGVHARPKNVGG